MGCFCLVHPLVKQATGQAQSQWGGEVDLSVSLETTAEGMQVKSYCRDKRMGSDPIFPKKQ